ncbi:MAG: radical SAM protein [candidate division KSB1 bacterium]|nr:radical SAM protein [candidate division KSB1 bacterium]MDZ7274425.1 radical SAM protein [candidate division KSB1 bacterium]MDZ7284913.1 radical SAM protein [candidate division KSB1 bacterium]MDZ7297666.1 radical SAM protein [candidate division KSB1 bacterium]MDZ7305910.1 radical SAM protein [candidate division KSB1 bacterium]
MINLPILKSAPAVAAPPARAPASRASLLDRWEIPFGREVALGRLLRALTVRRLWNAVQALASFTLSAILKRNIVWGVPPVLTIEPTNICNLHCPLCVTGNGTMERPNGRMDFPLYARLIDALAERALYVVFFNQGEPFIHRRFLEMVAYAHRRGLYTTTSSNAHYFDPATAEATVRSGLDTLVLSVDGATQETYSRYRVGGSLARVLQGIRNLVAARQRLRSKTPHLFLQFLLMKHNEHELPAMAQLARELGVDRFLKKNIQVETLEEARLWLPGEERYRRYHLSENDFAVKHGRGVCPRPWLTTMVNWDGTVVPCCFDKNGHHTTGDLRTTGFLQVWQAGAYQQFRQRMLRQRETIAICQNCNQGIGLFV